MRTFKSKPLNIEAEQWDGTTESAEEIIRDVISHGGQADFTSGEFGDAAVLRVRTNSGWARVASGWWVMRGSDWFNPYTISRDNNAAADLILDHYPCDPATFEKRWVETHMIPLPLKQHLRQEFTLSLNDASPELVAALLGTVPLEGEDAKAVAERVRANLEGSES